MKKLILSSLVFALVATGCSKNDDDDCNLSSASIVGTYLTTAARFQPSTGGGELDLLALAPACEKDDLVILNDNGVVTYQDAGVACNPNGNDSGTWSLSGNTLTMDGEAATVSSFECNTMVLKYTDGTGVTTVTLSRQ